MLQVLMAQRNCFLWQTVVTVFFLSFAIVYSTRNVPGVLFGIVNPFTKHNNNNNNNNNNNVNNNNKRAFIKLECESRVYVNARWTYNRASFLMSNARYLALVLGFITIFLGRLTEAKETNLNKAGLLAYSQHLQYQTLHRFQVFFFLQITFLWRHGFFNLRLREMVKKGK